MMRFDALILAGGAGSRMGGADKPGISLGGSTLLERALSAVVKAHTVTVVGPVRNLRAPEVLQVTEDPPRSGPASAIGAGLRAVRDCVAPASLTVVLAADLPAVVPAVQALLGVVGEDGLVDVDGWIATDPSGRRQHLLAVYRTDAIAAACDALVQARGSLAGASVRQLLHPLRLAEVPLDAALTRDIDTTADLAAAHESEESSHVLPARA